MSYVNETAEGHKQGTFAEFEAHVAKMGRDELEARAIAFWQLSWECDRAGVMAEDPGVVEHRIKKLRTERDSLTTALRMLHDAIDNATIELFDVAEAHLYTVAVAFAAAVLEKLDGDAPAAEVAS